MDRSHAELNEIQLVAAEVVEQRVQELSDSQLVLVGGGIADPIL